MKRASEASEASRSEMVEISRSLQLCMSFPSHIGKKKIFLPPSGTGVIRKCQSVCASVRLCVCASVRLCVCPSPQKSAITFEQDVGSARNFLQRPHSWRVIFGRVTRTPDPTGRARTPKNRVYGKSITSGGYGPAGSCCTSSERGGPGRQNVGSGILIFCPCPEKTGPEVWAGPGGAKNGIRTFSIKGTPTDLGSR